MKPSKFVASAAACGALALTASGCASSAGSAAAAVTAHERTFVLATLPSIGTVYRREGDCARHTQPSRFALGFRASPNGASSEVRFRTGRFSVDRSVQPGSPTKWFRSSSQPVQWLAVAAGGEGGVVVAVVHVDFRSGTFSAFSCSFYDPPQVTVYLYPRRAWGQPFKNGGPGGILRPWPIP